MKLAIVGSRAFNNYNVLATWTQAVFYMQHCDSKTIVSGGAKGADFLAKRFAENNGLPYIECLPAWDKYGKSAGFIRNQTIVDNCDMVLAFWDGESRGTANTILKAKRAKKPTFIVYV